MVTLQGEKKRWNGIKPWRLNDFVSSFNPCAPCSLESLRSFPCFSPKGPSNNMVSNDMINWSPLPGMNKWAFIWPVLSQLASRVETLAMASSGSFTSGFLPRKLWGDLAALARLTSRFVCHGKLWTFALWNSSPSTRLLLALTSLLPFHSPLRANLCTFSLFYFFVWCLEFSSCTNG